MEVIGKVITSVFLISGTIYDCKTKKVPGIVVIAFPITGMLFSLLYNTSNSWNWLLGASFGVCFFLLAKVTKQAIGYADAWMITGIGATLGITLLLPIFLGALFLTIPVSILLLFLRKVTKKTRLPFIPFLLTAFCIQLLFKTMEG